MMSTPISSQTAGTPSPFASWKGDHAGIRVPDFDAAVAWYTQKLDFRLTQSCIVGELTFAFLAPAFDDHFSVELLAGPGADKRPPYDDLRASFRLSGWHHVCFRVDSVDDAIEALRHRGVAIVSEPHDVIPMGRRVAFFADPWGNLLEVTQPISN
jgi:catechol 2,3-dioxygenase-like lactoylglutathione lyase family enzyme